MTNEDYKQAFNEIRKEAKKFCLQVKEIQKGTGDYNKPVNSDLVKTTKAMFFEKTLEILRKYKKGE